VLGAVIPPSPRFVLLTTQLKLFVEQPDPKVHQLLRIVRVEVWR
jgi:hypothetical protein